MPVEENTTYDFKKNPVSALPALTILLGLFGLAGWGFNNEFLRSFLSDGASMKVNTALLLITAGAALCFFNINRLGYARFFIGLLLLLSAALMIENLFDINLGIDQLFFKDTFTNATIEAPGRTSLLTAINALLTGIALLCLAMRRYRAAQLIAVAVFAIVYISLMGHLFHISGFYYLGHYSGVAFHTALGLLCLAAGVLAARPQNGWLAPFYRKFAKRNLLIFLLSYSLGAAPLFAAIYFFIIQHGRLSPSSDVIILLTLTAILSIPIAYFLLKLINRIEADLARTGQRLEIALNAGNLGAYELEIATGLMTCSSQCKRNFGLSSNAVFNFPELVAAALPQYRDELQRRIKKAIDENSVYQYEYQINRPDGQIRWISASGKPEYDTEGNPKTLSGVAYDITNSKKFEEELQQLNEELAASNEELGALNEEQASSNEELQQSQQNMQLLLDDLATSEAKLDHVIEQLPASITVLTGPDFIVERTNASNLAYWKKSRENTIGKPLLEVLPELAGQAFPIQLKHVLETGETVVVKEGPVNLVVPGGEIETTFVDYSYQPITDQYGHRTGVLVMSDDVTEKVKARQKLELSESDLQAANEELASINEELKDTNDELLLTTNNYLDALKDLAQSRDDLLFTIDAAGLATFDLDPQTNRFSGNELLKSWFGLEPKTEIDLSIATNVIAEDDRERVEDAIRYALDFRSGGKYEVDYVIISAGNPVPRMVRAKGKAMFNEQGKATRLSGTLQDITEQKKDEQRKNDFIGMVSHELKTPLTSLTAIVQVLNNKLKTNPDQFIPGALGKAAIQVGKMSKMIDGFLNISRLESGKIAIVPQDFSLNELLTETIGETELTLPGSRIILEPGPAMRVHADRDKIASVISNLFSNAVKYAPKDKLITVNTALQGDFALISVRDEGLGIDQHDQQKLFDRYYRVENPNTKHISGFGIGLYLSAEIVQRHGGRIWVESEPEKGSVFSFTLPVLKD